jgi:photosystem II stability/assembly factor-like uncharacterized protein
MKAIHYLLFCLVVSVSSQAQSWWNQTSNTSRNLTNINFLDTYRGFSFGDTLSTTRKTTSSGVNWGTVNMAYTKGKIRSSAFLNPSTLIAVGVHDKPNGKGIIFKTQNDGNTWSVDTNITEKLFDVSFVSASTGWISGENGYVAKSTNWGSTWLTLNTGTGEDLFSVYFVNLNEGWAVGTVDTSAVILKTTNGGTNWTRQSSGILDQLFSVFFANNMNGWAVGANGTILSTLNGGTNWVQQISGVQVDLFDVAFTSTLKGWAVGGNGTILKTVDGGITWTQETSGTSEDLKSISMKSDTRGWICGDGGTILVYGMNPPSNINELNTAFSNVTVFPNPASEFIKIEMNSEIVTDWEFNLFDSSGKMVFAKAGNGDEIIPISPNYLSEGLYFYSLVSGEGIIKKGKLVIQQ